MSPNTRVLLIVATLAGGLAADVYTNIVGQTMIGLIVWLTLFSLLSDVDRDTRFALMACLVIATAGEILLSLGWGLYTYRLDNIPLFVPPGHVLMLLLGFSLARRMPDVVALAIIGCAGVYSLAAAAAGVDTLGALLFLVLAAASLAMPNHRSLYASTFVLALALELYGTWLGNWSWAREVPGNAVGNNQPAGGGRRFYSALDALVLLASVWIVPRLSAWVSGTETASSQALAALSHQPCNAARAPTRCGLRSAVGRDTARSRPCRFCRPSVRLRRCSSCSC